MAGSDVKTKRLTATGDASIGRARVRQVPVYHCQQLSLIHI